MNSYFNNISIDYCVDYYTFFTLSDTQCLWLNIIVLIKNLPIKLKKNLLNSHRKIIHDDAKPFFKML